MDRLKSTICALIVTITISSTALAGNIGGMRTTSAGNIGGMRTSSAGNIGGMRTSSAGNIGGLRTKTETSYELGIAISENIGGLIRFLLESAALF